MSNAFEQYTSVLKGGTTPTGGSGGGSSAFDSYVSGAGVKVVKPQQQNQPTPIQAPIQVQPVTPAKTGLLSRLKTGFQEGGIGGAISNLFPTTQTPETIAQNLKTFVETPSPASYVTKEQADKLVNLINNPIDTYIKTAQNEILAQPNFDKTPMGKLMLDAQKVVERTFELNPTIRGFAKGASTMYLNSSEEINKLYDKQLAEPTDALGKTLYKMGEIPAAAFTFLLGGEALKAANFGRATLPILFASLGQTSAPYNTTIKQRIEKMPVDLIAGYLFGILPPAQVAGLKDILSPQVLKNIGGVSGIVGLQTFIDGLIFGMSPEDAAKAIPQAVSVAILFYTMAIGTGLIDQSTRSKITIGRNTLTPSEAKDMVYNAGKQKTPTGERIIQFADTANTLGKDLRINYMELQKSWLAEKFNLNRPQGSLVKIDFVSKAPQTQIPGTETAVQPTATGVPTIVTPQIPQPPQGTPVTPIAVPSVISNLPKTITENVTKFIKLEDFTDSIGAKPTDQVGKMDPNTITARDPVDEKFVSSLVEKIKAGEELESIRLIDTPDGKIGTQDGSNRLTAHQRAGKPIDVIYPGKNKIEGLVTLKQVYEELNKPGITKTSVKSPKAIKTQNKGIVEPKTTIPILDSLNPTGGVFVNYTPRERMIMKLGDNITTLDKTSGKSPNTTVTIYRGAPKNQTKINPGDFVTTNPELAKTYTDDKNILKLKVKMSDVLDDVTEPLGEEYIYRPKNNTQVKSLKVSVKRKKVTKPVKQTLKQHQIEVLKEALAESNPMDRPEIDQYRGVITKAIRTYNLTKAKGNDDISTITKKVPELDSALDALSNAGFEIKTMDELVALKNYAKTRVEKMSRAESITEDLGFNPKNLDNLESPVATKETDKIIKRSEIARQLSEKLNVPIRTGKFRRSAAGLFKRQQKVIRVKGGGKSGGLPTKFHEVAHFIDSNLNLSKNINVAERKALMEEYAYTYEGKPRLQQEEAFAEFLRFRMTGQEERANRLGPKFSKYFDEKMNELPEIKEVLDTATTDYQRWREQPASAKVLSQISIGNPPKEKLGNQITSGLHKLYTIFLDDLHPLSQFSELAKRSGVKMRAEADPYILARTIRGWGGISDLFLNKGTFDPANYYHLEGRKPKMVFTGKSLSEILKPVARAKAENELRIFLVSKRVVEDLSPRGIETGVNVQDAKNAIEEVKAKYPDIDFEKIGQEIIAYQDSLLKYASSPLKGLIGPEGLKKIKDLNKYHVPFYRVMEELQSSGYMGKKKIAGNMGSPIKKIKGSEREIIDPLESLIKDTYAIINASERNSIGVAMANLSKLNFELGRLFEKVDSPMKATRVTGEEIVKGLAEKIGMDDLGEADKESLDELAMTIFRPTQDRGQNMLNVNMGDKKLVFQVDPDLFNAIQGLNQEDVGLIMKILSLPAKTLRLGATLSPDFSVRNPLRDTFTATIFSDYGFKPGVDLVKGMFDLINPSGDVYNLWKASGGQGSMFVSVDRERLQENYRQLVATKGEKALNILKNPIELLKLSSEIGEEATRLGEMRNALVSGASPKQSAYASREVTLDFARIGAKTRAVNMIKAFFNSQVQGTDKMIRAFKTHPFRSLLKSLLLLTLPTILLYFANRKDKRWKEIPQWQKDLFWIVLTKPSKVNSSGIWRIPKPFEVGMLFASVPERVLEYIDTKDSDKLDALAATIMNGVLPDLTPIPSAGIPIVENMTNYSFFLERPIVSRGQENLPPEAQYGAYTSETAKLVGQALGYSPSKIDNLIQGYAGGLGKYSTELLDVALKGSGIATPPPAPASDFENMPVLRAFTIRNPIGSSSESVNTVYKKYGQISVEMNYVTKLAKGGEEQKAIEYIKKHPEVINAPLLNDTITTFSAINKKVDEIRKSKDLTPREKKVLIDKLGQAQTDLAQNVLEQMKIE